MPRVAFMTPQYFDEASYLGGGERYPLNHAKAVAATGRYEVDIVSYGDRAEEQIRSIAAGVRLRVLPSVQGRRAGTERVSWEVLAAVRDVDLVHLHQIFTRPSEVALLVAKLLGRPVCATDHGGATSQLGRSLGMLDLIDRLVAQSAFAASALDVQRQVQILKGGVDDGFFTPLSASGEAQRSTQGEKRGHVLFVGRLLPHKGIDRLIAALPADVRLVICGRPYDETYHALLRALASGKQVEFLTSADDLAVRELYRTAFAIVLPSVYVDCYGQAHVWPELMGFSLLEGMACGTPAICSRVGGMPEYVDHGRTGFVFDELAELSRYIERLAGDAQLVTEMGSAARRQVEDEYGLASIGPKLATIYDELLEVGHREGARDQQPVPA